jgi:predicted metal-dependent phosphoesterase TrpH
LDYDSRLIDLHVHSTASDGTNSPAQLIRQAERQGLGAIALTDHDTVSGVVEAIAGGIPPTMKFIAGVEISTQPPSGFSVSGSLHILGYGIPLDDPDLLAILDKLQHARKNRNPEIIHRLNKMGIQLSLEEIRQEVGAGQLGRPHIARALVSKGIVGSIEEVFAQFLGKGKPAYVDKFRVPAETAVGMIRRSGGVAVLAHPGLLPNQSLADIDRLVSVLTASGLQGIEAYYPGHSPEETAAYEALAERHGLLLTGGSDFHGSAYGNIEMGCGRGDLRVPMAVYERLQETIAAGCPS